MMLQLYGNARSRAMRCLWMLEEIGEPYQLIEKSTRTDDLQSAEYLRLNPNARIPTLVDGDFILWESMAINLYLAQKYQGPMHCADPKVLGLAAQWSFWTMLEMEALLLDLLQHRAVLPEFARDASYAERDQLLLRRPLAVLNSALNGRDYLTDSSFTVADLNLASILAWGAWIYRLIRISAMARQLFGATCLRPSARSDKAQVSAHPDFAIELTGASHQQKLRSASWYCTATSASASGIFCNSRQGNSPRLEFSERPGQVR